MMTSGGDSSSSEPGSPSRPITPHHMTIAPVPAYECLRADSEDSGLGPSPAKSLTGPTSPEGSVSPIRFDDRSDSLLDLSPRTDNSDDLLMSEDNNGCCESCQQQQTATAIPQLTPGGSSFQFLIASKNCVNKTEDEDFCMRFTTHVTDSEELVDDHMTHYPDEELHPPSSPHKTFDTADDCSDVSNVACVVSSRVDNDIRRDYVQESLLNPKVVLIRSDFGGQYTEESCSQQSSTASTEATADSPQFEDGACKWVDCDRSADDNTSSTDLLDHLRQCHVQNLPEDAESFACLWVGCKVYARPSCSRSWLQRHVLLHGGSKPFRCIVAGCRQRFGTEAALQRHVNSHFPHQQHPSHHNNRLARARRRQHYKNRKRPQSHKSKDYFDDATMELVRHNLFQLSSVDGMTAGGPPSAITFHSTVKARRISESGKVNLLLHWSPENMVPDAWVAEDELCLNFEKTIPVSQLPHEALQLPVMDVFGSAGILSPPGKCKRK